MRKILTSLLAMLVSGLAGGIVAQQLAVWTGAGEEFIAVFFFDALVVFTATPAFFAAQFFGPSAVAKTALALFLLFALLLGGLAFFSISQASPTASLRPDLILIGSIAASGLVILATHWLIVRWRLQ